MSEPATPKSRTRKVSWQLPRPPHSRCWSSRRAHRPASAIERERPRRARRKRGARGWSTAAPSPAGAAASPHPQGRELRPAEHREHGAPADDRPDRRADAPYSRCADPVGRVWPPPLAAADARPPRARARSGPGRPAPASAAEAQRKIDSIRGRRPLRGPRGVAAGEAAHLHASDQEIQAANARRSRSWYRTSQRARCRTPSSASSPGTAHAISRARGTTSGRTWRRTVRSPRRSRRPGRPEPAGIITVFDVPRQADPRVLRPSPRNTFPGTGCVRGRRRGRSAQAPRRAGALRAGGGAGEGRPGADAEPDRDAARAEPPADRAQHEHGRQHLRPGERECGPDRARAPPGAVASAVPGTDRRVRVRQRASAHLAGGHRSLRRAARSRLRQGARSRSCSRSSTSARGRSSRAVRAAGCGSREEASCSRGSRARALRW